MYSKANWAEAITEQALYVQDLAGVCPMHRAGESCLQCRGLSLVSSILDVLGDQASETAAGVSIEEHRPMMLLGLADKLREEALRGGAAEHPLQVAAANG